MKFSWQVGFGVLAILSLIILACPEGGGKPSCISNGDCPEGMICGGEGECVESVVPECSTDSDCSTHLCVFEYCVTCGTSYGCAKGWVCNGSGNCVIDTSDGGSVLDGGNKDGGTAADGGASKDGGTITDGAVTDSGTLTDSGTTTDGTITDGGTVADGGAVTDGGASDGGTATDGGGKKGFGEVCGGNGDCVSNICIHQISGQDLCTRECTVGNPCPSLWNCDPISSLCMLIPD